MMTVSATELRKNIFAYLDRIAQGERIAILRNKKEVARLIPSPLPDNAKDKMKEAAEALYNDYKYDSELTAFTVLDGEDFYAEG